MLTQERAEVLAGILNADEERAKNLMALEPSEALKRINALGNDFTLDEINEFGKALKASHAEGELDADTLDNVAGGSAALTIGVTVGIVTVAIIKAGW